LKNARHERFAQFVVAGNPDIEAYVLAGYSPKAAQQSAYRLRVNAGVRERIAELLSNVSKRVELTAANVLEEIRRLAFVDMRGFYDNNGQLKRMAELSDEQGSQLASIETLKRNVFSGDRLMDTVLKAKIWDKPKALELLCKHFGLTTEKVEHSGDVVMRWQTPEDKQG
jgi:phage terminase small subunit